MTNLEKIGAVAGIALPLLAGAWWAGAGYIEFSDRLAALEREADDARRFREEYGRQQVKDGLVNEQVKDLAGEVEWLKFHHHDEIGGRGHVDGR